jgi:hypothetical protein
VGIISVIGHRPVVRDDFTDANDQPVADIREGTRTARDKEG